MSNAVSLTDGSRLVARGALHAGVDYFVGYPITPASGIYAEMIRAGVGISAPDEITALQYLIGASLNGRKTMTATSGPGFLLMSEGIGAALAMEVPLTVVLVQRLGPATGSATMNAQGDVGMAGNIISGGFIVPVLCPSRIEECAEMTAHCINLAEALRVPTVLLTEKDMVVGKRTVELENLNLPEPVDRRLYDGDPARYESYGHLDEREVPPFVPLGHPEMQVRVTASTHDARGMISSFNEKVRHDTERLLVHWSTDLFPPGLPDIDPGAEDLIVTFGFTTYAAREAVDRLRAEGRKVSLLVLRTLIPVPVDEIRAALEGVRRLILPEENISGLYLKMLRGEGILQNLPVEEVVPLNVMGRPVTPEEIIRAVGGDPGRSPAGEVRS
jgi:2-oxoglutarate ferredoxin oxidoreductase subunit alpha